MKALDFLSQTYSFDGDSKDLSRIGLTWTVALRGITDRQIASGKERAVQEHRYKTIRPADFRAYCLQASEAPRHMAGGLTGRFHTWFEFYRQGETWNWREASAHSRIADTYLPPSCNSCVLRDVVLVEGERLCIRCTPRDELPEGVRKLLSLPYMAAYLQHVRFGGSIQTH